LPWENKETSNTEYVIENLKEDTEYEFVVYSLCGSENGDYTGPISFTTKRVEDCGLKGNAVNTFDLLLYPNPVNTSLNFYVINPIEMDNIITVQIFDNAGRTLLNSEFFVSSEGRTFYIPTNNFASGMYYVNFVSGDSILTKKVHIIR